MRRFVYGLFVALGVFTALAILGVVLSIGAGLAIVQATSMPASLPGTIVLSTNLGRGLGDGPSQGPVSDLVFGGKQTMRDFLDVLERAGDDPRVKGIYTRLGDDSLSLGDVQQVRDAIHEFRKKGKFAIAFAESFGEFGPGTRPYYLATAFDEIWLQPLGSVGLVGLQSETPFFRGALDKLGVTPSFEHREEYKTAMNGFTETAMTAPQREEIEDLLSSMSGQIAKGIATDRNLPPDQVTALIDRGPFLAAEAKDAHLIDRVGYADEAVARARDRAGSGAELIMTSDYLSRAGHPHTSGPTIALIYGTGLITQGGGGTSGLLGSSEMSAAAVGRAFRAAFRDPDVRAILFRINSPGGSAVASETIWREVVRARERGKPVIVSMGNVAGSGGYYVAAPADKIVAEPGTLTGSIGVLAGKFVIAGLMQKLGVTSEAAQRGANAGMFSEFDDFSPVARERLARFLDATYDGFKAHVAEGRHMSADQVEAVAKGRVWSGEEAKAIGLVDVLGGYDEALRLALEAAKLPPDKPFQLTVYPRKKTAIEEVYNRLANRENDDEAGNSQGTAARLAHVAGVIDALSREPGVLQMPPVGDIR